MNNSMEYMTVQGIGGFPAEYAEDLLELSSGGENRWQVGVDGVHRILGLRDHTVEFIIFADYVLAFVNSAMGFPAIYPLVKADFFPPARAVLMDLDGTTVNSEQFWIWIIEQVTARLLNNPRFNLNSDDLPFVSGQAVSEHLQYCLKKYCPSQTIAQARAYYYEIAQRELLLIQQGKGYQNAFQPCTGLRDFLLAVKARGVKVGLVSSGLREKALPAIRSVFNALELGNPMEYYDTIITAGTALMPGQFGTLGELEAKPHPWLYAEAFRLGFGMDPTEASQVVGLEDSSAGAISVRLAGLAVIGLDKGSIRAAGARPFLYSSCHSLHDALQVILGE